MDAFAAIAEPTRREILDRLRGGDSDVTGLVRTLRMPQPLVSKHLRVLRECGAVTASTVAQRRVYRLAHDPLSEVLAWVEPYHAAWAASLEKLERALADDQERG